MGSLQVKKLQNIINTDAFIDCFKAKPNDKIIIGRNNTNNAIFVKNTTTDELYEFKYSILQQGNKTPKEKINSIIWNN